MIFEKEKKRSSGATAGHKLIVFFILFYMIIYNRIAGFDCVPLSKRRRFIRTQPRDRLAARRKWEENDTPLKQREHF